MKLAYRAFDEQGTQISRTMEAASVEDCQSQLREKGLFVAEVREIAEGIEEKKAKWSNIGGRGKRLKQLVLFFRQLSILVTTGTPLVVGLDALRRQAVDPAWRKVIKDVQDQVSDGLSFSQALASHPEYFDSVYCSLIEAGESGGDMRTILERLAVLVRQQLRIRSSLVGSLTYPCALLGVVCCVMLLILSVVLPRFEDMFASLSAPLPPSTELMLAASRILRAFWWQSILVAGGSIGGVVFFFKSKVGGELIDNASVRLPQVGPMVQGLITAQVTRILGVLMLSGVTVLDAIRLSKGTVKNRLYLKLLEDTEASVIRGDGMSAVFTNTPLISSYVSEAVRSGEDSGQLGPVLTSVADFLDEENEMVVKTAMHILEPFILVLLGLLVGGAAISLFLPLFDLTALT